MGKDNGNEYQLTDHNSTLKIHITERLAQLRSLFTVYNIDWYIVPSTDEYQNEYVPANYRRLEFITGFSGSNGIAIIGKEKSFFFTDGRYILQAHSELNPNDFVINHIQQINPNFLNSVLQGNIGYDPNLFTTRTISAFNKLPLVSLKKSLIDSIFTTERKFTSLPYDYPAEYAGLTREAKINQARDLLNKYVAQGLFIGKAEVVCWLFNIRASDIEFCPLLLARSIITNDKIYIFTNNPYELTNILPQELTIILPQEQLGRIIAQTTGTILFDENTTNLAIIELLKSNGSTLINVANEINHWLAVKNNIEIKNTIRVHIEDAVAMCEFFACFYSEQNLAQYNEHQIAQYLSKMRAKQPSYISDSFSTICGFNENGAIIHYQPNDANAKYITTDGILLLDSGGHYWGGTTDITRTIAIGTPTKEQKYWYTKVLKGHIALANIKFPLGVSGSNLDILARQFLWDDMQDYDHGTGHGVGNCLNVHEGPQGINLFNNIKLLSGMILSNEPGFYVQGKYGIRIENLMYIKECSNPKYLSLENLTLVPYDNNLIEYDMLTKTELEYIASYYKKIYDTIYHLLSDKGQQWLISAIKTN